MIKFDNYVEELGEVLKKFNIEDLDAFLEKYKETQDEEINDKWKKAPSIFKEMVMCIMILNRIDMPKDLKEKAQKRLNEIKGEQR